MAMSLLTVVLVAALLTFPSLGTGGWTRGTYSCSAGWELVEDTCFCVFNTPRSWHQSQSKCRSMGGDLATISNEAKQTGVAAMLIGTGSAWIGVNDIRRENHYVSSDGSDVTYTKWSAGQPNNLQNWWNRGDQDCVEMNKMGGFRWNDDQCYKLKRFVCQRSPR